jgi:hypothetical protein
MLLSGSVELPPSKSIKDDEEQEASVTVLSGPALAVGGMWLFGTASFLQETKIIISTNKAQAANFNIDFMMMNFKSDNSAGKKSYFPHLVSRTIFL